MLYKDLVYLQPTVLVKPCRHEHEADIKTETVQEVISRNIAQKKKQ
jgi:hypothetical protein